MPLVPAKVCAPTLCPLRLCYRDGRVIADSHEATPRHSVTRSTGRELLSPGGCANQPVRTANGRQRPAPHRWLGLARCGGSAARGGPLGMKRVNDLQHGVMGPNLGLAGPAGGRPRRCRISVLASLAIRRAVAPREEEAMLRERFEDTAQRVPHTMRRSPAARCADLLIARYRCSGRGDLRCPCLANTAACR